MLKVFIKNIPEIHYTVKTLFHDFLNVETDIYFHNLDQVEITLDNKKKVVIKDSFFLNYNGLESLKLSSIPNKINWMDNELCLEKTPVLFGDPVIIKNSNELICEADIIAGSFFMLSRWEEAVIDQKDRHNRFIAEHSLAVKEGFIEKPIVNMYAELIWKMIKWLGVSVEEKRKFSMEVSHDIDIPFLFRMYPAERVIKKIIMRNVQIRSVAGVFKDIKDWIAVRNGNSERDPYHTYDLIMDTSEEFSLKSTFFFLAGIEKGGFNGHYDLKKDVIRNIIRRIALRGHSIGLHGSYNSYNSYELFNNEFKLLKDLMKDEGIKQSEIGSRQHFLRWKTPETGKVIDSAGVNYDTTLCYGERPGFRAGTCYPFRLFDLKAREELNLIEKPLILMDCSLTEKRYLDLSYDEALKKALDLKNECRKYKGLFTVLWHNTYFSEKKRFDLYKGILKG